MTREKDRRRWSLRRLAVTAAVVALCALLAGCGGGDTGDKISAPFESGKCKGMELEVVKSQLAEAGFTNIQEKPQETATEFLADSVISVKIGSNTSWNSANSWKPDTKIIIEYYAYTGIRHIDVTMDIAVGGEDGKPVFTVQTSLPDGSKLSAELSYNGEVTGGHEDYVETQTITVQDGKAQTAPFTKDGEVLTGQYRFGVIMLPAEQSQQVQEIVGASGEAMRGTPVKKDGDYSYIAVSMEYTSPVVETVEKISEEALREKLKTALSGFGDDCTISEDGYVYTLNVWQKGLAQTAMLAQTGDKDAKETWDKIVYTTMQASDSLQELLTASGYGDYMVQIQVLNDQNHDNTLLTVIMGMASYNCVS